MPPVSNDRSTGAAPTPVTGSTTAFSGPHGGAAGPTPGATTPGVTVVDHDIPGARPVGTAPTGGVTGAASAAGAGPYSPAGVSGGTAFSGSPAGATPGTGTTAATGPACVPDPNYRPNPAQEAATKLKADLDELKEYASYYVAAKIDGIKGTVRNLGLYAALGVVGAIVGTAILATAAGLLVVGFAHMLGALFGGRYWLGDLVTGILILGAVAGGAYYMMNKLTGTWRSQTLKKYEERKQSQRERFSRDVSDRARQAAAAQRAAAAAAAARGSR
jgi:hypothetical protein